MLCMRRTGKKKLVARILEWTGIKPTHKNVSFMYVGILLLCLCLIILLNMSDSRAGVTAGNYEEMKVRYPELLQ